MCFFSCPRLGVTVPLKPGDFLLVNALEYHCLSSRCQSDVVIYCVSSYLKQWWWEGMIPTDSSVKRRLNA